MDFRLIDKNKMSELLIALAGGEAKKIYYTVERFELKKVEPFLIHAYSLNADLTEEVEAVRTSEKNLLQATFKAQKKINDMFMSEYKRLTLPYLVKNIENNLNHIEKMFLNPAKVEDIDSRKFMDEFRKNKMDVVYNMGKILSLEENAPEEAREILSALFYKFRKIYLTANHNPVNTLRVDAVQAVRKVRVLCNLQAY